tara:strand:- start:1164 stop:2108 length:945 start_codon:yes stop_codon:yes gene_type:complete
MAEAQAKVDENEEDSSDVVVEIDTENEETEAVVEGKEESSTEDVELRDYSENVKKRIHKMTAKLRESERRELAATEYAQAVVHENNQLKQKTINLDGAYVNEFDNRVQTQEKILKQELKKAIDLGDSEKQADIQIALSNVANDKDKVSRVKRQQAAQQQPQPTQAPFNGQAQPTQAPFQPPFQQPSQQPVVNQTDPVAQKWASEREWFGEDRPMTLLALAEHESLLSEGYDPQNDSESYYTELNNRIEVAFPHKFQKDKKRKSPRVASASRVRVNKRGKKEVVLTESEAKMADKLNVPRAEYGRQLEKIRLRSD